MGETDGVIPQIRTGSVVRLKSGGPLMTVAGKYIEEGWFRNQDSGMWACDWIDENGQPYQESYYLGQLKIEQL